MPAKMPYMMPTTPNSLTKNVLMVCHEISSIKAMAPVLNSRPVRFKALKKLPVIEARIAKKAANKGTYQSNPSPYFLNACPINIPCKIEIHGKKRSKNIEIDTQKTLIKINATNAPRTPLKTDCS